MHLSFEDAVCLLVALADSLHRTQLRAHLHSNSPIGPAWPLPDVPNPAKAEFDDLLLLFMLELAAVVLYHAALDHCVDLPLLPSSRFLLFIFNACPVAHRLELLDEGPLLSQFLRQLLSLARQRPHHLLRLQPCLFPTPHLGPLWPFLYLLRHLIFNFNIIESFA